MEMYDNTEKIQRALLVGIDTGEYDAEGSMDELFELVKSAGDKGILPTERNRFSCFRYGAYSYSDKKY